jgi:lipoic acid synthetase
MATSYKAEAGVKLRGADKVARIPIKVIPTEKMPRKPDWLRIKMVSSPEVNRIKSKLREHKLASVCEEANCPNLGECFSQGTATFMIMGEICTRRCPFCDVAHGRPNPLSVDEPRELATAVADMALKYVVITSVDRDDLRDGGALHFSECISAINERTPATQVEVLVPDFRGRMDIALDILATTPPHVFNHNLESIPRLYKKIRPQVLTKSGLMLGLGETNEEVLQVLQDLRDHGVDMLTLGQYLQPSLNHLPVDRFVHPTEFDELGAAAKAMGFKHVASGPLVRSSYHADLQVKGEMVT